MGRARPRRAAASLVPGLLVAVLLGLLVSCGSAPAHSPSTAGDSSDSGSSSAGDGNGGGTNAGGNDAGGNNQSQGKAGGGGGADKGVAWVPFGPQDPSFPTPTWPVYNAFASGDCSKLADALPSNDVGDYGELMLAVCQAAIDGQSEKWDTAESLAGADAGGLGNDCVAPLVQGAVERALSWHREHPHLAPQVELQPAGDQTQCGAQAASETDQQNGDQDAGDTGDTPTDQPTGDAASTTP